MNYGIKTLDDADVRGKTVLLRVDINEPVDKEKNMLKDTTRIEGSLPTISELADKGAKVVIMAHQGSDIEYKNFYTTAPHAKVLSEMLKRDVKFIDDVCGPAAREAIKNLKEGEILLLDNVRHMGEEQTLFEKGLRLSHEDQAKTLLIQKLAPLADIYVNDAFAAAHRDQPSLCAFQQVLPSYMGRLFEKEYTIISDIKENPDHPCVFVLGGAKVADAFMMMESVLSSGAADTVLTGGLVANIMLVAKGVNIGDSSLKFIQNQGYGDLIKPAVELLNKYTDKIKLPKDLAAVNDGIRVERSVNVLIDGELYVDIGENTVKEYQNIIKSAKTVFVNGPVGVFENEPSEYGTKAVWDALGNTEAYTVIGGGDSIAATNKYKKRGDINYICTGGGSLVRFLSGEELPVIRALRHAARKF